MIPHVLDPRFMSPTEALFLVAIIVVALVFALLALLALVRALVEIYFDARDWFRDEPEPPAAPGLKGERQHLQKFVVLGDRRRP